jgi:hypothetical protein
MSEHRGLMGSRTFTKYTCGCVEQLETGESFRITKKISERGGS